MFPLTRRPTRPRPFGNRPTEYERETETALAWLFEPQRAYAMQTQVQMCSSHSVEHASNHDGNATVNEPASSRLSESPISPPTTTLTAANPSRFPTIIISVKLPANRGRSNSGTAIPPSMPSITP
ncbi:hypothetical protein GGF32_000949 [Allomyces javanicus]|nr:hypothetical protein GGF32_000949 [Allomyces javanicus]